MDVASDQQRTRLVLRLFVAAAEWGNGGRQCRKGGGGGLRGLPILVCAFDVHY